MKTGCPIMAGAVVVKAEVKRRVEPVAAPSSLQPRMPVVPASAPMDMQLVWACTTVSRVIPVPMLSVLMRSRDVAPGT